MAAKVHILYMHKFLKLFLLFCGKINYEWLRSYLGTHSIDHIISFAIQCANMKCIYMTDIQHKQAKLEVFFVFINYFHFECYFYYYVHVCIFVNYSRERRFLWCYGYEKLHPMALGLFLPGRCTDLT